MTIRKLTPAQDACLRGFLAKLDTNARPATIDSLRAAGLLPHSRGPDVVARALRTALEAMRSRLSDDEIAEADANIARADAKAAAEVDEVEALRGWLARHGETRADVIDGLTLSGLRQRAELLREKAGAPDHWRLSTRHAAACRCAVAEQVEPPPSPDRMIAAIQAGHPGALVWARLLFGPQVEAE